jgi:tetratricopeptide (TPR) repeat protein
LGASYEKVRELSPANHRNWSSEALLRLQRGDIEGYRGVCREMLARFSHTEDPITADGTAKTCLLAPAAVADLEPVLRLADRAITGTEQNFLYCWHVLLKGMAEYRAEHFANAIDRLNQALSLGRQTRYFNSRSLSGTAHAFLAMAHHRLGRVAQAREALDRATELLEQPYAKIGWNWNIDSDWDNWLSFYLIRQEAEKVVKGDTDP